MNHNITEFKNDPSVIRHTNLVVGPGALPRRVVLRDLGNKFVTHVEYMRIDIETRIDPESGMTYDYVVCSHHAFDAGHYFEYMTETNPWPAVSRDDALIAANKDFEGRAFPLR